MPPTAPEDVNLDELRRRAREAIASAKTRLTHVVQRAIGHAKTAAKATADGTTTAAKATAGAAKDTAKATDSGVKKAGHAVAGTTYKATCNDGTTYSGATKDGACAKNGGVKSWDK